MRREKALDFILSRAKREDGAGEEKSESPPAEEK
jgi:hypothetical protein